jgi:hypothetical protein
VPAGPLTARHDAVGAWVGNRFVVVGGRDDRPCPPAAGCLRPTTADLSDGAAFDPATGAWESIAPAPAGVSGFSTAVSGDTLYVRSRDVSQEDDTGVLLSWEAEVDRWTRLPVPAGEYRQIVAAGDRLVAVNDAYERPPAPDLVLDPRARTWRPLPEDPLGALSGRAAAWTGDRLVLSGAPSDAEQGTRRIATLDARLQTWTLRDEVVDAEGGPTVVGDRWVFPSFSFSGDDAATPYPAGHGTVLDPATGTTRPVPQGPRGRGTDTERAVVAGLVGLQRHLLDPVTLRWTTVPTLAASDERQGLTSAAGGAWLFGFGGHDGTTNRADGFLLPLG